jgi:hypothetical protein
MEWNFQVPSIDNKEMRMKKTLMMVMAAFALSSFSAQAGFQGKSYNWNNNDIYSSELAAAKVERKLANRLGFEWKHIGKFLKEAGKLHKKGDIKGALKLVRKAKSQAILGQKQAHDQVHAGPRF